MKTKLQEILQAFWIFHRIHLMTRSFSIFLLTKLRAKYSFLKCIALNKVRSGKKSHNLEASQPHFWLLVIYIYLLVRLINLVAVFVTICSVKIETSEEQVSK